MQSGDFNQCEGSSNPFLGSASSSSPLMVDSNVAPIVFAPSASNDWCRCLHGVKKKTKPMKS
ncbi:hypothetical protein F511_37920 [Dorcoceras hygrometricum]|uniref:Uncharacterized protein n=1 Tax=Dorcoceras hygrometricum TaxID=472368 RepID=A0A2Z7CPW2_9LAMI|nr:hypothetical protein F511_37920 [Dorcoceras hygrometricum]